MLLLLLLLSTPTSTPSRKKGNVKSWPVQSVVVLMSRLRHIEFNRCAKPFKPRKLLRINARPRIQEAEVVGSGAADSKLIQHDARRCSSVELDSAAPQYFQPFTLQGRQ